MPGLKDAIDELVNKVADLTELEVVTFSGDLASVIDANAKKINWGTLMSTVVNPQGNLKLVAATKMNFDGDAYNFRTDQQIDRMDELLKLHADTVSSSLQAREAIITFFRDLILNRLK